VDPRAADNDAVSHVHPCSVVEPDKG